MTQSFIVTGAAGGLGAATVEALAARGASVFAVDLDAEGLERMLASARRDGVELDSMRADVSEPEEVRRFVHAAKERFGRLDGIFNNAAVEGAIAPITEYPYEQFERVMKINVWSVWLGTKEAIPLLLENGGGAIVNTASTGGMMGWPQLSGYIASKHAVIGITRTVALELAGRGIRCNAISPGPMDTRMITGIADAMAGGDREEAARVIAGTIPVGRLGRPEEVAGVVAWLLTEGPEYLTGAVIPVDGAQTAGQH